MMQSRITINLSFGFIFNNFRYLPAGASFLSGITAFSRITGFCGIICTCGYMGIVELYVIYFKCQRNIDLYGLVL